MSKIEVKKFRVVKFIPYGKNKVRKKFRTYLMALDYQKSRKKIDEHFIEAKVAGEWYALALGYE